MYWSPSKPVVRILSELSLGNLYCFSSAMCTLAWKVWSSKVIDWIRPTTTPALRTAALGLSPPILSKRAVTA
ncbi:hypothetical protein D3C71_1896260 [compost metagenome]